MSKTNIRIKSLFIPYSLEKYQRAQQARELMVDCESAKDWRENDTLLRRAVALSEVSAKTDLEWCGKFYAAIGLNRAGEQAQAESMLEATAEEAYPLLSARSWLALGFIYQTQGDFSRASKYYHNAEKICGSHPYIKLLLAQNRAIIAAFEGRHEKALAQLEFSYHLANGLRSHCPLDYYRHLNSLATEYLEAGDLEAAEKSLQPVLESPFTSRYPEFTQTAESLRERQQRTHRLFVAQAFDPERNAAIDRIERLIYSTNPLYTAAEINAGADEIEKGKEI